MLVIRRRVGESLLIGPEIEVEVVDLVGGRVKLGVRAPREVRVLRKEVRLAAEQNLEATRNLSAEGLRLLAARLRRA